MTNKELINIYKNYKSLLSATASDIVAFKNSWDDEFCRKEINRLYTLLMDEFKETDFTRFNEVELKELDFQWFDDDLICMPTWTLDCLQEGSEIWSINGKKIITLKSDSLSKDTRFGISAYGFKRSQLRDSKLNSILDEQL
jgi:hypothetical protein